MPFVNENYQVRSIREIQEALLAKYNEIYKTQTTWEQFEYSELQRFTYPAAQEIAALEANFSAIFEQCKNFWASLSQRNIYAPGSGPDIYQKFADKGFTVSLRDPNSADVANCFFLVRATPTDPNVQAIRTFLDNWSSQFTHSWEEINGAQIAGVQGLAVLLEEGELNLRGQEIADTMAKSFVFGSYYVGQQMKTALLSPSKSGTFRFDILTPIPSQYRINIKITSKNDKIFDIDSIKATVIRNITKIYACSGDFEPERYLNTEELGFAAQIEHSYRTYESLTAGMSQWKVIVNSLDYRQFLSFAYAIPTADLPWAEPPKLIEGLKTSEISTDNILVTLEY
jgi:hypothetical protein